MIRRSALVWIGIGQCVNWGVLYYAFTVLVQPLERELGVPTWVVTGALSLALLMSAVLAPHVGAWCDRGHGEVVLQTGGIAAFVLLVVWTVVPGVAALYFIWACLGLCMAATLYEPAFAIVGREYGDPTRRLGALAALTLFGGLASTVFLPLTAGLVASLQWRGAVLVLAAVLIASTWGVHRFGLRRPHFSAPPSRHLKSGPPPLPSLPSDPPRFLVMAATFALVSLAAAAFTSNLVPALAERGIPPASSAVLGGLIGVLQLPGRAVLMNGTCGVTPSTMLAVSLVLQAGGFVGVAFAPTGLAAAAGTALFALGAGLTTLLRPQLVRTTATDAQDGYLNGRIARHQQLARAGGPVLIAWLAGVVSYRAVFVAIAVVFALLGVAWRGMLSPRAGSHSRA